MLAPHRIEHALSRPSRIPSLVDWQLVVSALCPVPFVVGGATSSPGTFVRADKALDTERPEAPQEPSWTDASDDFAFSQAKAFLNNLAPVRAGGDEDALRTLLLTEDSAGEIVVSLPADGPEPQKSPPATAARASPLRPQRGRGGRVTKTTPRVTRTSSPLKISFLATTAPEPASPNGVEQI